MQALHPMIEPLDVRVGDVLDMQIGYGRVMGAKIEKVERSFGPCRAVTYTGPDGWRQRQIIAPEDALFLVSREGEAPC